MKRKDFTRSQRSAGELAENGLTAKAQWYVIAVEGAGLWKTDEGFYVSFGGNDDDPDGPFTFQECDEMLAEMAEDLMRFEIEGGDMTRYRVTFKDGKKVTLEAVNEFALGSFAIIDWAAEEYDVREEDIFTDGEDIWVEKDGEQIKLTTVKNIEEVE